VAFLWSASDADAQICDGRAAFDLAPAQLGFHTAWTSDGHGTGLSLGAGRDRLFAIGSVERHSLVEAPAYRVAGTIGTNQPLRLDNRLHLCPMFGAAYTRQVEANRLGVAAGGSIGVLAKNSEALAVIPTLGVRIYNVFGDMSGAFAGHRSEPIGMVNFGVGLVILSRISLMPSVTLAFGAPSAAAALATRSEPSTAAALGTPFGRPHTPVGLQVAVSYNLTRRSSG
jgi:hypothetical protein